MRDAGACSLRGGELFLLHCVMVCWRQSNGKVFLDHYRNQRRRFAGDERVCHQSVTPTGREGEVLFASSEKAGAGTFSERIAPKPDEVSRDYDVTSSWSRRVK